MWSLGDMFIPQVPAWTLPLYQQLLWIKQLHKMLRSDFFFLNHTQTHVDKAQRVNDLSAWCVIITIATCRPHMCSLRGRARSSHLISVHLSGDIH